MEKTQDQSIIDLAQQQEDRPDYSSEISLIHFDNLHQAAFLTGLKISLDLFIFLPISFLSV